ncbi:MAG: SRPBCC domain-containing protein [Vicinamibacterales bacterium]
MTETYAMTIERDIPGPIAAVFDAWLDPSLLKQWMTPAPGMTVPEASVDPVVGGRFRIVMRAGDRDIPHDGQYQVIDRPNRLVFTWTSEPAGDDTLVTVTFTRVADDRTKVSLTHERFVGEHARDSHRKGWTPILDALARHMETRT